MTGFCGNPSHRYLRPDHTHHAVGLSPDFATEGEWFAADMMQDDFMDV
jgi:hypothetical protein